jgi:hypothetical protein
MPPRRRFSRKAAAGFPGTRRTAGPPPPFLVLSWMPCRRALIARGPRPLRRAACSAGVGREHSGPPAPGGLSAGRETVAARVPRTVTPGRFAVVPSQDGDCGRSGTRAAPASPRAARCPCRPDRAPPSGIPPGGFPRPPAARGRRAAGVPLAGRPRCRAASGPVGALLRERYGGKPVLRLPGRVAHRPRGGMGGPAPGRAGWRQGPCRPAGDRDPLPGPAVAWLRRREEGPCRGGRGRPSLNRGLGLPGRAVCSFRRGAQGSLNGVAGRRRQ